MGSIVFIQKNPKLWYAYDSGKKLKPEFGGEKLIKIRYGEWDDDPMGTSPLEMLMRESIYNKLINKQIVVSPFHSHELMLIDYLSGKEIKKLNDSIY